MLRVSNTWLGVEVDTGSVGMAEPLADLVVDNTDETEITLASSRPFEPVTEGDRIQLRSTSIDPMWRTWGLSSSSEGTAPPMTTNLLR